MADKSSKEELKRLSILHNMQIAGEIIGLCHQPELEAVINGIDVFKYTPDFYYIDRKKEVQVFEEYKGWLRERHDSLLRMKILSALNPMPEFRLYEGPGSNARLTRIYKAGKAVRVTKGKYPNSYKDLVCKNLHPDVLNGDWSKPGKAIRQSKKK